MGKTKEKIAEMEKRNLSNSEIRAELLRSSLESNIEQIEFQQKVIGKKEENIDNIEQQLRSKLGVSDSVVGLIDYKRLFLILQRDLLQAYIYGIECGIMMDNNATEELFFNELCNLSLIHI